MDTAVSTAAQRDSDIVALLQAGHRARAFDLLLPRYEQRIFRLCCALLRDRAQAQDAAQESLVRIWKSLDGYDGSAALSTWIYAVTRNRCLTALERRRVIESLSDDHVEAEAGAIAADRGAAANDREPLLLELVELLPERQRRVLLLHYYEERSTAEVAAMLGCPEGTVKTHLFRARAALADLLRRRGLDDPGLWLEDGR